MLLKHFIFLSFAFLQWPLLGTELGFGGEFDAVAFFRAIENQDKFSKSPKSYERLIVEDDRGRRVYDVDRRAAFLVRSRSVETIIVKKIRKYGSAVSGLRELTEEAYGKSPQHSQDNRPDDAKGYSYQISFRLARREGNQFISFANANLKQAFNIRINNQSVGVLSFEIPFERQKTKYVEFAIPFLEDDADKIKGLLSRFSGKVVWE